MKLNLALLLVGSAIFCIDMKTAFCRDDFLVIGDYSYLYTRPMTSSTLTKINTYLGSLKHVEYDPFEDKIYWATSSSIGRYDYNGSNKETLIQGSTTYNGQSCNSFYTLELDIDAREMYFVVKCPYNMRVLQRADMDGTNVVSIASSPNNYQSWTDISLDTETGDIYWSLYDKGDVLRVKPDGTVETVVNKGWANGASVAYDRPDRIFWTQYSPTNVIYSANTEGQNEVILYNQAANGQHNANDLHVYRDELWFIQAGGSTRRLYHVKTDGSQSAAVQEPTSFVPTVFHLHENLANEVCCPFQWTPFKGHCYRYINSYKTWFDADDFCWHELEGAAPVSIHSQAENDFVNWLVGRHEVQSPLNERIWIGLFDVEVEGTFIWVDGSPEDDVSPLGYTNWAFNQPDNWNDEDCAESWAWNGGDWNDSDCSVKNTFVCKL